jgi:hypothetical protein
VEKVIVTFVLSILVLAVITTQFALAQTNQTTTWTKYTDPQGRFSINHLVNWTAAPAMNRFQDLLVQFNNTHYTGLTIDVLPTNFTDPTVFANAYKLNHFSSRQAFQFFRMWNV